MTPGGKFKSGHGMNIYTMAISNHYRQGLLFAHRNGWQAFTSTSLAMSKGGGKACRKQGDPWANWKWIAAPAWKRDGYCLKMQHPTVGRVRASESDRSAWVFGPKLHYLPACNLRYLEFQFHLCEEEIRKQLFCPFPIYHFLFPLTLKEPNYREEITGQFNLTPD